MINVTRENFEIFSQKDVNSTKFFTGLWIEFMLNLCMLLQCRYERLVSTIIGVIDLGDGYGYRFG